MSATATQAALKERPIIFSGAMVRAIHEGRKTQTRRVVKTPHGYNPRHYLGVVAGLHVWEGVDKWGGQLACPYGAAGDRLWVRETWQPYREHSAEQNATIKASIERFQRGEVKDMVAEVQNWPFPPNGDHKILYAADFGDWAYDVDSDLKPWKSPLFLPRHLSRITLEIITIRVERLQEISDEDAKAEGIEQAPYSPNRIWIANPANSLRYVKTFRKGWDKINAKRGYSWASNPWVWVIEFKKL